MPHRHLLTLASALASALGFAHAAPAAAQPDADWSRAPAVEVVLKSFSFTPSTLRLRAGVPVRLTLRDVKGGHNFAAPGFFAAARIAPADAAKVAKGKVELRGGETVTIRLIPAAGTYKLACTHFLHAGFGMKGTIVVS